MQYGKLVVLNDGIERVFSDVALSESAMGISITDKQGLVMMCPAHRIKLATRTPEATRTKAVR